MNYIRGINIVCFNLLLVSTNCLYAQRIPEPIYGMLSPNAASIKHFGDFPVSLYTGGINIDIPLYSYKDLGVPFNLSIKHQTGGVYIDQHPGWVGMNWTLNCGGVITRKVNDIADELNAYHNSQHKTYLGFYHNQSLLNVNDWYEPSYLRKLHDVFFDEYGKPGDRKDHAPDEFSFYFGNYQGKFYLNHKKEWVVQCNKHIEIEFDNSFLELPELDYLDKQSQEYRPFKGFTIIAEDGTKYYFGGVEQAIEFSSNLYSDLPFAWTAVSWYLTKIVTPTGKEMNLSYEAEKGAAQKYAYTTQLYTANSTLTDLDRNNPLIERVRPIRSLVSGSLIRNVYLSNIISENLKITFERSISKELDYNQREDYMRHSFDSRDVDEQIPSICINAMNSAINRAFSTSSRYNSNYIGVVWANIVPRIHQVHWMKLDRIKISNKDSSFNKSIKFKYSNNENQRLTLKVIDINDEGSYVFQYFWVDRLPRYLLDVTDHWGFFNNNLPNYKDYIHYEDGKENNGMYSQFGTLTRIDYPTGGYTEFEYEPHDYNMKFTANRWDYPTELAKNMIAGGVRIKKIKNSATALGLLKTVKEYFYVRNYLEKNFNKNLKSSGVLEGTPTYYFPNKHYNIEHSSFDAGIFSTVSLLPSTNDQTGTHIGYTEVIEKSPDESFTRYQYSNYDQPDCLDEQYEGADNLLFESPFVSNFKGMERGLLRLKEEYDKDHSLIRKSEYIYEKDVLEGDDYVRTINFFENRLPGINSYEFISNRIYIYQRRLKREVIVDYVEKEEIEQTIDYNYTRYKLLKSVIRCNSSNNNKVTNYKYPFDRVEFAPYNEMVANHMLSPIIESSISINNKTFSIVRSNYYKDAVKTKNRILPKDIETAYYGSNIFNKEISYDLYDNMGNILQITNKSNTPITYLWSYDGQYPVATIYNAHYQCVEDAIGGKPILDSIKASSILSKRDIVRIKEMPLENAQTTISTYIPLAGVSSITPPSGITTYFEYQDNKLQLSKHYNNKFIEEYKYNYINKNKAAVSEPIIDNRKFDFSLNQEYQSIIINEKIENSAIMSKNSPEGVYYYQWVIKDLQFPFKEILNTNNVSDSILIFIPQLTGIFKATCTVTNLLTDQSESKSFHFSVGDEKGQDIFFATPSFYNSYNGSVKTPALAVASIYCIRPVTVTLFLTSFMDGDRTVFKFQDYGSKRLEDEFINTGGILGEHIGDIILYGKRQMTIKLNKGENRVYIYKMNTTNKRDSAADICIMKVEPSIDTDGYKNRYIRSVPGKGLGLSNLYFPDPDQ